MKSFQQAELKAYYSRYFASWYLHRQQHQHLASLHLLRPRFLLLHQVIHPKRSQHLLPLPPPRLQIRGPRHCFCRFRGRVSNGHDHRLVILKSVVGPEDKVIVIISFHNPIDFSVKRLWWRILNIFPVQIIPTINGPFIHPG